METFNIGEEVKVIDGIPLDTEGETTTNWAGTIASIHPSGEYVGVELDASTLDSLSDAFLLSCLQDGMDPLYYNFANEDLVRTSPRDTKADREKATQAILERMGIMAREYPDDDESQHEEWVEKFVDSSYFQQLTEAQKGDAAFAAHCLLDYSYNYIGLSPQEWNESSLEECCLEILPQKISAEADFFKNLGPVLLQFLPFLEEAGIISNAEELCAKVAEIKDDIPRAANNPANWSMAKSFLMGAIETGIDPTDQGAMDAYLAKVQMKALQGLAGEVGSGEAKQRSEPPKRLVQRTPFDKLNRNDRITVKYEDGTVKSGVKFKLVKQDLLDGKCEWID